MRAAGSTLTALALVLVQAPWIVCGCADDPTCAPVFVGKLTHGGHEHEGHCCDPGAHLAHGPRHAHGVRGRGHDCGHAHPHGERGVHGRECDDSDRDGGEPEDHVGFRMPLSTMPAPLALEAAATACVLLAATEVPGPTPTAQGTRARTGDPPGGLVAPSVVTERLLL